MYFGLFIFVFSGILRGFCDHKWHFVSSLRLGLVLYSSKTSNFYKYCHKTLFTRFWSKKGSFPGFFQVLGQKNLFSRTNLQKVLFSKSFPGFHNLRFFPRLWRPCNLVNIDIQTCWTVKPEKMLKVVTAILKLGTFCWPDYSERPSLC